MTTLEQRHRIVELKAEGYKPSQIAQQLGLSVHTVRKWCQRLKKGVRFIP